MLRESVDRLRAMEALRAGVPNRDVVRQLRPHQEEIEDRFQTRIIDWHWHTPNPYVFTARVVVELAQRVMRTALNGWLTPGDLLDKGLEDLTADSGFLRGCRLKMRAQPKPQPQKVGQSPTV